METLPLSHPRYPRRLLDLRPPPAELTLSGPLETGRVVAIVGTRKPVDEARDFAKTLAAQVVRAGGIVASGGAIGIDTAAHEGALDAGGRTWAVAPSGCRHTVPEANRELYARIQRSEGSAVLWPFRPDVRGRFAPFLARNGVLVALADAVVVVQAQYKSGARNAAAWARKLERPLWVVAAPPWTPGFEGCWLELDMGARLLGAVGDFLRAVGLSSPSTSPASPVLERRSRPFSSTEVAVLKALSSEPTHTDELTRATSLPAPAVTTALLTLALENVVVEGPGGFFRRT